MASFTDTMRFGGFSETVLGHWWRRDCPCVEQRDDPLQVRTITGNSRAQHPDIRARWAKSVGCGCDPDQSTARLQDAVRASLNVSSNRVEYYVAVGDDLSEILGVVVNHPVYGQTANIIEVGSARRGNHGGAEILCELDRKTGDTARAPLDQDRFAGLELRGILDRPSGGDTDQRQRRGLQVGQAIGFARDDGGLDRELLRICLFDTAS